MASRSRKITPKVLVLDVDGVLTDGKFHYSADGKVMKVFGPDDADAISLILKYIEVRLVSGDKRGFDISKKRADDMKLQIDLVSTFERVDWIEERYNLSETIYMGDGIYDALVFQKVGYGIAPDNAFKETKKLANFVTKRQGASGAVAEAVIHILKKFFKPFDILNLGQVERSGAWKSSKIKG